jgi:exoenzyme U
MGETLERADWIRRMLGMPIPLEGMGPLRVGPPPEDIDRPSSGGGMTINGTSLRLGKGGRVRPTTKPTTETFGKIAVTRTKGGGPVSYTAPRPPIAELNFAGGGGKGTALFGAVQALQSGTMDKVKRVNGASVGAITSALLAAGITVDELKTVVDSESTVTKITDGTMGGFLAMIKSAKDNKGSPLTGEGVRDVVAGAMGGAIQKRIKEAREAGGLPKEAEDLIARIDIKDGPTFLQMRELSHYIPAIKEISVTGTYREELDLSDYGGKQISDTDKNQEGQLFIFSADTTPDMPVALAVQASAAFPIAFKPVDIDLSKYMKDAPGGGKPDAWKVRFVDGGVMNNTPTQSSIGNERPLDPLPTEGSLNFVFQGSDSAEVIEGKHKFAPGGKILGGIGDKVTKSKNWAAEFGLALDAQEHAEDFVVVPLKFQYKNAKGKTRKVDMSGTLNGTLNFTPKPEDVQEIRKRTKDATEKKLKEREAPVTTQFANTMQMFMAIGMDELAELARGQPPFEGAAEAHKMREDVNGLIALARTNKLPEDKDKKQAAIGDFLKMLDDLAKDDPDRTAYIAREIHKARLDAVIDGAADKTMPKTGVGSAIGMVSEAKKVYSFGQRIMKGLIIPKMRIERKGGASFDLLMEVCAKLRKAVSWDEVIEQLALTARHYLGKSDKLLGWHGHEQFYNDIKSELNGATRMMNNA